MRHLIVVRHAKSSWDDPSLDDHDRPLAQRGVDALPKLATHLGSAGVAPEVVLCSTAARARATLEGVRSVLPADVDIMVDERLYHAGAHWLVDQIRSLDDERWRSAMVVGHNPGLHELVLLLIGTARATDRVQLGAKFPTAAAATFSFDDGWTSVEPGAGHLDDLFLPRRSRS